MSDREVGGLNQDHLNVDWDRVMAQLRGPTAASSSSSSLTRRRKRRMKKLPRSRPLPRAMSVVMWFTHPPVYLIKFIDLAVGFQSRPAWASAARRLSSARVCPHLRCGRRFPHPRRSRHLRANIATVKNLTHTSYGLGDTFPARRESHGYRTSPVKTRRDKLHVEVVCPVLRSIYVPVCRFSM